MMEKNLFLFDQNKCVGCGACAVACMNENGYQSPDRWRNIHSSNPAHHPFLPLNYLSLACNHCDDAPCLKNCPTKAYQRDVTTGAVIHSPEKCIGCKYCTWACPYDAPKYNPEKGVVEKCTFCNHRLTEGQMPACAYLCPTGALSFEAQEFSREESIASSPVPVNVGAHFKSVAVRNSQGPEVDGDLFEITVPGSLAVKTGKITADKEWPLVVFSLIASSLVAIEWLQLMEYQSLMWRMVFLIMGGIGALFSMLHLGQKQRAWRSLLHVQHSWLSREILFFSLFMGAVFVDWFIYPLPSIIPVFLGAGLLISIDMLYVLAMWRWPLKVHSAQTSMIALSLFLLISNLSIAFGVLTLGRAILFVFQHIHLPKRALSLMAVRLSCLLISVFGLFLGFDFAGLLTIFAVGEIMDRIGFYNQLKVPDVAEEIQSSWLNQA